MQVQVIAKENGINSLIKNYSQKIQLTDSSIVLIDVKVEDIEKIEYLNNQVVITLKNGEKIVVDNFNIEESSLVFRNEQVELFLFDFKTITYNPIDKIEPLLYGQSESSFVSVWPFVGLALGGIGLIAGAAGGSGGGGSSETVTKVKKPQDVIIGNGDSFINKEEVQDDKVEVTVDLPTGLTDQDKVIVNGEEHALTQEDVEAGKIVVNVPLEGKTEGKFDVTVEIKDKAGNVSDSVTESAIIDLTPPIVDDVIIKIDRIAQDGVINIEESNDKVIVIGQLTSIPEDSIVTKIQVTVGEETVNAIIFDFKNGIWSAQLQGSSFGNVAGEVNATVTFKDQAGNTSTKSTASNYEVDLSKPEVKSIEPADKVLAKDEVVTITITFNEEIKGLELSDFEAKGGLISGLQQSADDKTVWTLSFKQAGTDQPSLKLKEGSYTDLAGNPGSEKVLDKANGGFESDITPPALGDVIFNIVSIATDGIVNAVESTSLNVPIVGKLSSIPSDSTLTAIKVTVGDQVVEAQIVNLETGEWTANIEGKHFLNNTQVLAEATFKDAAGNTSAKTTVENYTVDTTAPKVESITASDTLLAKGEKVIITVKFSEEVKGLDINDFVPVGGSVNNLQQSATDKTVWTLEFVQEGADQPSLILKEGSYTDLAGNPGSEKVLDKANGGFESDITPPALDGVIFTIETVAQDGIVNIAESQDKVTIVGKLTSIPADSIETIIQVTVGNETVNAIIDAQSGTWAAVLSGSSFINVANQAKEVNATVTFKDQAGNTSTKSTASNYEVDLSKPEVKSIEPADKVLAKDEAVTITITFNEEIKGLELSDFEAKGGLISGLQQSADDKTVWTLSFKQAGTDQPSLKLKEGSYTDLAGNPGSEKVLDKTNGGFESDITPPALGDVIFNIVSIATDGIVNAVESTSLNVPIVGKLSSIPSDSTLTAIKVTVGGQVVEAEIINLETGEWTANIAGEHFLKGIQIFAEATLKNAAGNSSTISTIANYQVDTTAPKVESITASDTLLAEGEKVTITIKFSEEVKGLDINDFVAVGGSVNNLQQSATDKTVWTLEFVQEGTDQPSLILKEGSYTDLAGNPGSEKVLDKANGGFESDIIPPALDGVIFTIETVAQDGIVNIAESQDKVTIVGKLTSIPADSIETIITVTVGTETVNAIITDAVTGTWTAELSGSSLGNQSGTVNATVTFKDKAGNEVTNSAKPFIYSVDLDAPTYVKSHINEDGKIVLEFDELLDNDNPPTFDSFVIIKNTDEVVEIQGVEIVDQQVVITTVKPIYQSDKVQVSYVDKDLKDKNAIQDDAGNGSSEFNTGILSNDSLLSGLVSDFNNISGVPTSVNQDTLVASGRDFLNLFNVTNSTQNEIKAGTEFTFTADEYAGNHSVQVSLDTSSLLSVAKAYGVVLQQKNNEGEWVNLISAPMGQNGVVASLGTQYALGAIDNNSASVTFSGLEPGQYRIATYADQSELKKLISDIELANLGQGGYLLGKDNQDALIKELKLILGKDSVAGATLVDYLEGILNAVNLLTFPISALVDKVIGSTLLNPLMTALDKAIDVVVGNLVNNLVSVLQKTTVTVSPSTTFYTAEGNVIDNDALDNIEVKKVEVTTEKSSSNEVSEPVITEINGSTVINGKYGKLMIQPNGAYKYTVSPQFANADLVETFKYTVDNGASETLTINISKATQELLAVDNNVDLNLNVAPSEHFMTKAELGEYSKTTVNVAYIGLGSVLDLGALTPANALQFTVDPLTEQVITFNGKSGGVQVLTNYNLYVYKLNEKTNKLDLVELKENWFGVALLGGASKQPATYTFDEGQYYAVLEPASGVNALYGYTLEASQNKVLNYANPISVAGIAKGNLITDIDLQAKGQDVGPNIEHSFITQVVGVNGAVAVNTDQITDAVVVQGKYGQLTIAADGTYSYEAFNSKNFNYGDVDEFTYTIFDPISGQSDDAQLNITLDFSNTENGLSTVVALLEIEPTVKTLVEKVELEDVNLNTITKGKINATAFSVAEISLGDVVDAGIISADNSINISVKSGELANIKFHASAYQAVSVASIFDLQVYKKLDNGQLELFYSKPNYVILPVTVLIPLGGIHIGDPINLDFPEGEYVALLKSTAGIGALGGTTLEVKEITIEDYNNPIVYKGEVSGQLDIPVDGKIYTLNGKNVEGLESTVVKGTYGTLTYHADGTYEYFVDATYQIPQFGMIDTFSYSYKKANGEVVSSILNVKLSTVDANQDKQFDSEKKEIDIAAPMVNKVEQVIIDEKTGLRLPIWDEIKDKESKVIEIVNTPYMTTDLTFSLNVDLDIKGLYKTGLHFELYEIIKNAQTGEVTYSKVGDTISLKDVQKDTLSHTWENLKSGTYTVKYSIDGHNGTGMDYGFNFSQTYNYHDSWTSTGKDADYLAGQVIGNFLSNDKFALGLKDQAIVKFGNKYLYLGSNEVQEITVYGSYGDLVVKSDGSYVFTPNGLGGGREYFDYEIISPTGESDKAAIEFSVAKVIQGNEFNNLVESSAFNDIYTLSSGSDTVIFDVLDLSHNNGGNGIDTWTDFHLTTSLTDENADKIDVSSLLVGYEQGDDLKEFVSIGKTADGKAIVQIDRDGKADEFQKTDLLVLENQTVATQQAQLDLLNQLIANQQLIG